MFCVSLPSSGGRRAARTDDAHPGLGRGPGHRLRHPRPPRDLAPRTIEAAYEDAAHYLGTLPAEYRLDIEQRELTKHPPAVDQVNDLLASLGFAAVQPFTAIAWTNRHGQPVVLVVAERDRLPIGQCDHGLRQTITRRPFRGPVAHPGNPYAREGAHGARELHPLRRVASGERRARGRTRGLGLGRPGAALPDARLERALPRSGRATARAATMRRSVSRFTFALAP